MRRIQRPGCYAVIVKHLPHGSTPRHGRAPPSSALGHRQILPRQKPPSWRGKPCPRPGAPCQVTLVVQLLPWITAVRYGFCSVLVFPGFHALPDCPGRDDECCGRVGPPPTEPGVEANTEQGGS